MWHLIIFVKYCCKTCGGYCYW